MNNMNSIIVIVHSSTKYGDENLYFSGMEFNKMCINWKQIHLKLNTSFLYTTYIFI